MKCSKKGFTIVELIVTIAVIAILCAVLIPVFSGVISMAEMSSDRQTVDSMNAVLSTEDMANDNSDNRSFEKSIGVLRRGGYILPQYTQSSGTVFVLDVKINRVFLMNKDMRAEYPAYVEELLKDEKIELTDSDRWFRLDVKEETSGGDLVEDNSVYENNKLISADRSFVGTYRVKDGTTCIGKNAFFGCYKITEIIVPDSVENIEDNAFWSCESLKTVNFGVGSRLKGIGEWAFKGCNSLFEIIIPSLVEEIKDNTFIECVNLTKIVFGDNSKLTAIGRMAFYGCEKLSEFVFPDNLQSIGEEAFVGCEGLKSIFLPASIISLGEKAFYNCSSISSFSVDSANEYFCDDNGVLFDKQKNTLICYPAGNAISSYVMPDSVVEIARFAFGLCGNLSEIKCSDRLKFIREGAFFRCRSLLAFDFPVGVERVEDSTFYGCAGLTEIVFSQSLNYIGVNSFYDCKSITGITVPVGVNFIGGNAFYGCINLKTVINLSSLNIEPGKSDFGCIALYADKVISGND